MSDLRDIMNRISAALKDDTGVNKNQLDRIFTDLHTELTKSDWAIEDEALREEYEKMFVHWTAKRYLELTQAVDVSVDLSGSANASLPSKLAQSNSKSEDTSLDDIFAPLIDSPNLTLTSVYWYEAKQSILAWHKAERAKLFEQIRSKVQRFDPIDLNAKSTAGEAYDAGYNQSTTDTLEALTRLEKNEKVTE